MDILEKFAAKMEEAQDDRFTNSDEKIPFWNVFETKQRAFIEQYRQSSKTYMAPRH